MRLVMVKLCSRSPASGGMRAPSQVISSRKFADFACTAPTNCGSPFLLATVPVRLTSELPGKLAENCLISSSPSARWASSLGWSMFFWR